MNNQIAIGTIGKAKPENRKRFWKGCVIGVQPLLVPDGDQDIELLFHPNFRRVSDFWVTPDRFRALEAKRERKPKPKQEVFAF